MLKNEPSKIFKAVWLPVLACILLIALLMPGCALPNPPMPGQAAASRLSQEGNPPANSADNITQITDQNFKTEVLEGKLPVVVYFWATWSGPCRLMTPVVEAAAEEYDGRVKFCKFDASNKNNTTIIYTYTVTQVPYCIMFIDGYLADRWIGNVPLAGLRSCIDRNLAEVE